MKVSRYNLVVKDKKEVGNSLVYNTLSGAIVRGDEALIEALVQGDIFAIMQSNFDDELAELGILVPDGIDELNCYREIHNRWKSGQELAEFNMLITYDCNFACPYCYQGRGETGQRIHGFRAMSRDMIETFRTFVKRTVEGRNSRCLELVLYGGEPLLMEKECRETADELAKWAEDNDIGFKLNILSNGSLITASFVEWASDYAMRLQIPIDGGPTQHNRLRFYKNDGRGSFDDVTRALALTRETNIETHIRVSLTDETYPTMEHMLDVLKERGLKHIYTDFCYITAFTNACADYQEHVLPDRNCLTSCQSFGGKPISADSSLTYGLGLRRFLAAA